MPEEVFRRYVQETREADRELTAAGLMRLAKSRAAQASTNGKGHHAQTNGHGPSTKVIHRGNQGFQMNVTDIVHELSNHHDLLQGVVGPICSGESDGLRPEERRVVQYLLGETKRLLDDLQQLTDVDSQPSFADRAIA